MIEKIILNLEQLKAIHMGVVEETRDNPYWLRKHNEARQNLEKVESKLGIYLKMLPPEPVPVLFLDELNSSPEVLKAVSDILQPVIEDIQKKITVPRKKKPVQAKENLISPKDVAKSIKKKLGSAKKAPDKKKISVSKQ